VVKNDELADVWRESVQIGWKGRSDAFGRPRVGLGSGLGRL